MCVNIDYYFEGRGRFPSGTAVALTVRFDQYLVDLLVSELHGYMTWRVTLRCINRLGVRVLGRDGKKDLATSAIIHAH